MEFLYLLGRFHVVVLHLPIGIGVALLALQVAVSRPQYQRLEVAVSFLWGSTALTALVTVILGYLHYLEVDFSGDTVLVHMVSGTTLALISTVGWAVSARDPYLYTRIRHGLSGLLLALLIITGHSGGNLTHGSTYLWEYAPQPIRSLVGLEPVRLR